MAFGIGLDKDSSHVSLGLASSKGSNELPFLHQALKLFYCWRIQLEEVEVTREMTQLKLTGLSPPAEWPSIEIAEQKDLG